MQIYHEMIDTRHWLSCPSQLTHVRSSGPVFIKHLKSNVYVTLNAVGSFQCNLCSHWLIHYLSFFMNTGPEALELSTVEPRNARLVDLPQ